LRSGEQAIFQLTKKTQYQYIQLQSRVYQKQTQTYIALCMRRGHEHLILIKYSKYIGFGFINAFIH